MVIFAVLPVGLWFLSLHVANRLDESARQDIVTLQKALAKHHARTGIYPDRIDNISASLKIETEKIMLVVPKPQICYLTQPNGYRLQYYHWPLGPFLGYDSRTNDWYCEE